MCLICCRRLLLLRLLLLFLARALSFMISLTQQFSSNRTPPQLHSHVVAATDQDNIERVWKSVHTLFVKEAVGESIGVDFGV